MTSNAARTSLTLAVECSRLAHDVRGIGRYVRALLPRLASQREELRLIPFARRRGELDALRASVAVLGVPSDRCEVRLFDELHAGAADLWWYPWNVARPTPRVGTVVATMQDVAPLALPDPRRTKWLQNRRWRRLYRATATRAEMLLTISRFTAREIEHNLGVAPSRIRVTPLAADDLAIPNPGRDTEALARLGVRSPYVLAINANDRRKNLALLDRAMPHVADGKYSGDVRLQKERIAIQIPPLWPLAVPQKIRAGENESAFVAFNQIRQPVGTRHRADENKHGTGRYALDLAGVRAKDRNFFKVLVTMCLGHAGVRPQLDIWCPLDLIDEILRHGPPKGVTAH